MRILRFDRVKIGENKILRTRRNHNACRVSWSLQARAQTYSGYKEISASHKLLRRTVILSFEFALKIKMKSISPYFVRKQSIRKF